MHGYYKEKNSYRLPFPIFIFPCKYRKCVDLLFNFQKYKIRDSIPSLINSKMIKKKNVRHKLAAFVLQRENSSKIIFNNNCLENWKTRVFYNILCSELVFQIQNIEKNNLKSNTRKLKKQKN